MYFVRCPAFLVSRFLRLEMFVLQFIRFVMFRLRVGGLGVHTDMGGTARTGLLHMTRYCRAWRTATPTAAAHGHLGRGVPPPRAWRTATSGVAYRHPECGDAPPLAGGGSARGRSGRNGPGPGADGTDLERLWTDGADGTDPDFLGFSL